MRDHLPRTVRSRFVHVYFWGCEEGMLVLFLEKSSQVGEHFQELVF